MKKGRIILISVAVVIIVVVLITGGKMYMDNKKEVEKLEAEKQSVELLKKKFSDIKKVEIERTGYNKMTGFYRMVVKMTNDKNKTARFDYGFVKKQNELSTIGLVDKEVQEKGTTTNKVKVIYSNGKEEEV
ncbi:hypothetical protein [Listeria kieliensis]|uniref:Membrane protein n=1 Tax=Listeria kieliensis TaxID=1621700 RepID=A0A3D8TKW4_9LIST|nr:hypothetical protein [Listeria kieliensis]RDW99486.1 membrane protein [Listeria kieliensis]